MSIRTVTGCVLALGLILTVGCQRGPGRLYPPSISASAAGAKAIELFDTNKDGKISGAELDKCPGLKAAVAQVDTSGAKAITAAMITARIQAWQESKIGRMPVMCTVLHNGSPLVDADVKFVPEPFLGESYNDKIGSGKTQPGGMAMISIQVSGRDDPPGMPPGFYRIEITKAGEKIPAKYNTETTLGQEVVLGAKWIQSGVLTFDLKY